MKVFDIISFAKDYGIEYHESGYKQCRPGWVQFLCPYCNSHNPFLGYHLTKGFFNCYHCGFHPIGETIVLLSDIPPGQLRKIFRQYSSESFLPVSEIEKEYKKGTIEIPNWWLPLSERQLDYLYDRGFDNPEQLAKTWGLFGSGHVAPKGYAHRIVIPYYTDSGKVLCYTSRSMSEEVTNKYKASPLSQTRNVKDCLYGLWNVPGDSVVVVEGQVDVWKLGMGAVATGGTAYTQTQVKLLKSFKKRFILYDNEPQAQEQAGQLASEVSCFEGETWTLELPFGVDDPGELVEKAGKEMMKEILYDGMDL